MARPLPEPRSYAELPSRLELRPRLRRSIKLSLLLLYLLLVSSLTALLPLDESREGALSCALLPGLVLLAVAVWLFAGRLVLDRQAVTLVTPLFRHRLAWEEIESVRMDSLERAIAFTGGGKRLVAPGPEWWGADESDYGIFWIEAVANEQGIELERHVRRTPYLWCRGTRRWRWASPEGDRFAPPARDRREGGYLREP